jgi:hypothetical protein
VKRGNKNTTRGMASKGHVDPNNTRTTSTNNCVQAIEATYLAVVLDEKLYRAHSRTRKNMILERWW